jgi:glycosyltransferase involved in cell wall biosynthesis
VPERESDRLLRVVTLVDRASPAGGGETYAAEVARRLDPSRFDRTLVISRWGEDGPGDDDDRAAVESLRADGVKVVGLGRTSRAALWSWRPLLRMLRKEDADVLHAHKFGSNLWGSLLGGLARTPVIVSHEHSWSYEGNAPRRFLDRQVIGRLSDAVVAVSREDQRRMTAVEGIPAERTAFIPLGIAGFETATIAEARARLGVGDGVPVVGAVGGLRREKRFDLLIRAVARLRDEGIDVEAVILGEGSERGSLEALVGELGLADRVSLPGYRDDVPALLGGLDVAVLCSEREGSPLSVMEYMEAGRPIVASAVGGVPDLIEDGVEGRLVPPGSPEALANAIGEILADPGAAAAMGERARSRRRAEFDIGVSVGRVADLYEALLHPA